MDRAACKGMAPSRKSLSGNQKSDDAKEQKLVDPFFPGRNQPVTATQAICLGCEVWRDCKAYAKRTGAEYGVWAGELKKRKKPEGEEGATLEEDDE
jgi:hypothetical protein